MYCDLYLLQESGKVGQNSKHCLKLKGSFPGTFVDSCIINNYSLTVFFLQSKLEYIHTCVHQFKYVNRCSATYIVLNE